MREDAARHRPLLDLVEEGNVEGMLRAIRRQGQPTFLLDIDEHFEGHSSESRAWLEQIREEESHALQRDSRSASPSPRLGPANRGPVPARRYTAEIPFPAARLR